jgi:hypothetical protein
MQSSFSDKNRVSDLLSVPDFQTSDASSRCQSHLAKVCLYQSID